MGEYTKLWLENLKQAGRSGDIFVFEPSSAAMANLQKEFTGVAGVKLFQQALSDRVGEAVLYSDFAGSGSGSLTNRNLTHVGLAMGQQEKVPVGTLADFCQQQNVSKIDFLKMDVEGYELAVLKGAANMLAAGSIRFIQFEFGGTHVDTRVFFKDFYYLLSPKYNIYRILKNGLWQVVKYGEKEEIFSPPTIWLS